MKEVKVEWIDSTGAQGGWQFVEDCRVATSKVTTYGFVVREDDDMLVIAQSYSPADGEGDSAQVNGVIAIPKVAVISSLDLSSLRPGQEKNLRQL